MQSITLGQCFKGAWRDALRAVLRMPLLFLTMFVLLLITTYINQEIQAAAHVAAAAGAHGAATLHSLYSLVISSVAAILGAILSVRVIRYSLDTGSPRWGDGALRRYLLLCIAFTVAIFLAILAAVVVLLILNLLGLHSFLRSPALATVGTLIGCGVIFVGVRLSLLFSHTAAGGRIRWRAAWHDTRGHFWVIFWTGVVTLLPVIVLSGAFSEILNHLAADHADGYGISLVVTTFFVLLSTATTATCAAWIYRRFAAELLSSSAGPTYATGLD